MGEKGLDEVYEDRNLLACALAESTNLGGWTPAEEDPGNWAIVFVETPHGQISWHVPRDLAEKLVSRDDGYEFDGHDREMKNDRLASWTEDGCWR